MNRNDIKPLLYIFNAILLFGILYSFIIGNGELFLICFVFGFITSVIFRLNPWSFEEDSRIYDELEKAGYQRKTLVPFLYSYYYKQIGSVKLTLILLRFKLPFSGAGKGIGYELSTNNPSNKIFVLNSTISNVWQNYMRLSYGIQKNLIISGTETQEISPKEIPELIALIEAWNLMVDNKRIVLCVCKGLSENYGASMILLQENALLAVYRKLSE